MFVPVFTFIGSELVLLHLSYILVNTYYQQSFKIFANLIGMIYCLFFIVRFTFFSLLLSLSICSYIYWDIQMSSVNCFFCLFSSWIFFGGEVFFLSMRKTFLYYTFTYIQTYIWLIYLPAYSACSLGCHCFYMHPRPTMTKMEFLIFPQYHLHLQSFPFQFLETPSFQFGWNSQNHHLLFSFSPNLYCIGSKFC